MVDGRWYPTAVVLPREVLRSKSATAEQLGAVDEELKPVVRAARDAKEKADSIENAVYDLKAVNPNRTDNQDKRTPSELLNFIEERGREADAALARLRELIAGAVWMDSAFSVYLDSIRSSGLR